MCSQHNITTYSSPKAHSSQKNSLFDMQIFRYNKQEDYYTCPANEQLQTNDTVYKKANHKVKHYKNRQACKKWELRESCTTNKNGRFIERSIYQEDLEENEKRVNENPKLVQTNTTNYRTSIWNTQKTMGLYLYTHERQQQCLVGSKHPDDMLQPEKTHVHFFSRRTKKQAKRAYHLLFKTIQLFLSWFKLKKTGCFN